MDNKAYEKQNEKIAMSVSRTSILANVTLTAFKLIAGLVAHSGAMLSDAVHSASDVISTFIVMIGVKISGKEADEGHPYGHDRFECVASIILAIMLGVTGVGIGYAGMMKLLHGDYKKLVVPGALALVAAVVSIAIKEGMYWYTRHYAKEINSTALMADAWHHRSDALSSVGSFIGILGARLGMPAMDPLASVVICVFILKATFDIFFDAIGKMTDHAVCDEDEKKIREAIMSVDGVLQIDELRTRKFGSKIYVDVEVGADGGITFAQSHDIAEAVHHKIEEEFPEAKHCMVHMNPVTHLHESDKAL